MDNELNRDLDVALSLFVEDPSPFTKLDGKHEHCIMISEVSAILLRVVAERNRNEAYARALLYQIEKDGYIRLTHIDNHVVREPLKIAHFKANRDGYMAKALALEMERAREEAMREAEYRANIAAVESAKDAKEFAGQANTRARSANRAAWVAGGAAVLALLYDPVKEYFFDERSNGDGSENPGQGSGSVGADEGASGALDISDSLKGAPHK